MKRNIRLRRISSLLLAAAMTLLIPISASASEPELVDQITAFASDTEPAEWQKTTVSYKIPYLSKWISDRLTGVLKQQSASLSGAFGIDLGLNEIYSDSWINGILREFGAQLPGAFQTVMSPTRMYLNTANIANDLPQEIKAQVTTATTWANIDVNWGVTDRDSFLAMFPIAARPFTNLVLRADIRDKWLSHYVPALRALDISEDQLASKEQIDDAYAGTNNYETRSDLLLRAVLQPVLLWAEGLQNDLVDVLLTSLPNLAYRVEDVNNLNGTLLGGVLLGALGVDVSGGFLAFFENTLGAELAKMGLTMPPIGWDLVAHAGDIDPKTQKVASDEKLMCTLILRYIKKAADMPENKEGFNALIGPMVGDALGFKLPAFLNGFLVGCVKVVLGMLYK